MKYLRWIPTKTEQDVLNPRDFFSQPGYFIPPSAVYMRRWTGSALIRMMASRLLAPIHYLNQCWLTINWTLGNKLQWNCNRNSNTFIEDTFENVVHFNLARSSVMLACCRGPTPHIHLMARFWIFSKAYLSLLVCGSHIVAAYSAVDLTKLKYAVCFSCVGHFLRFLRINPRRLLHLFAVIVMWSEKYRDLCNKMPK